MTQAFEPALAGAADEDAPLAPEHLRALLADIVDLAAVVEPDGSVCYLNRAGRRLLGLRPDAPIGRLNAFASISPSDQGVVQRELLPALAADGWWTGNIAVRTGPSTDLPSRSTFRLQPAIGDEPARITWIARDISTEKAVYERLHKKIFEDELTGLPHRSIFLDRLDLALRRSGPDGSPVALMFISLDRFKEKNDRFGRDVGD
ncbi:MAG TPA: diguanylate cyclase, partial [Acidimicrobiales bacterium]|nr:diguanylate cyclase [Acidimicrobiales bacterium]